MHNAAHESDNATPEIIELGYDTRDVHIPALIKNIVVIWALVIGTMVAMVWMLNYLKAEKAKTDAVVGASAPLMLKEGRHIPQAPLLQQDEQADLQGMKDTENKILNTAGWVERNDQHKGIVHIPIDRAIDLVSEKASKTKVLPYWPVQPAQAPAPTQAQAQESAITPGVKAAG